MDYCNSIFDLTSAVHLHLLQSVVNAAARLIVKRRKCDHITNSLRDDLHWLPVQYRSTYKLCTFVYKCLHGKAPSYLTEQCVPVATNSTRKSLRSVTDHNLALPRTHLVRYGQRSFGVAGPATWNQLPTELHDPDISFDIFRKRLKTALFSRAYYS